jgi:hypothetical protein
MQSADLTHEFDSAHPGHAIVSDDDIDVDILHNIHRRRCIAGDRDCERFAAQGAAQGIQHGWLIVDE